MMGFTVRWVAASSSRSIPPRCHEVRRPMSLEDTNEGWQDKRECGPMDDLRVMTVGD